MADKITEHDSKTLSDILEKWDALSMCELKPDADGYTAGLNYGADHCHDIRDDGRGLVEKLKRMAAMSNDQALPPVAGEERQR